MKSRITIGNIGSPEYGGVGKPFLEEEVTLLLFTKLEFIRLNVPLRRYESIWKKAWHLTCTGGTKRQLAPYIQKLMDIHDEYRF